MGKDTLCILSCHKCGWHSPELTEDDMLKRGVPWYCDDCGRQVWHFINFEPEERAEALKRLGV